MMHPISHNRKFAVWYFISWMIVELVHAFILWHEYTFPLKLAIYDSFVSNLLYCILGLALWYPVYYSQNPKISPLNKFINLATAGILSVITWYSLSYLILHGLYEKYTNIDFHVLHHWRIESGIFYFLTVLLSYYIIEYQQKIKEKQKNEEMLQIQLKEAELNALKSQINPHFLFNSLNSISALTMYEPEKAQEMIIKLSEYLRYSVSAGKKVLSTYEEEINNIHKYLDIEHIRFGDRISFTLNECKECKEQKVPTLILQPLFENAIKHGVNESNETVHIELHSSFNNNKLNVTISNNTPPEKTALKGTETGLKNIKSRLALLYGSSSLVKTTHSDNTFTVNLEIPQTNN